MTRRLLAAGALLSLVTIPLQATAQPADTSDPARVFTDPNFLPYQGMVYGTTGYTFSTLSGDQIDDTGVRRGNSSTDTSTIEQQFGYGITDDLAVIVTDTYVPLSRRSVDPVGGPSFDRDRSGISDPSVEAVWRAIDERSSPVLLDLFASYSPNLIESTAADAAHEGSLGRGGQAATLGLALGHEWTTVGVRGTATADWMGGRTTSDPSSPAFSRDDSSWNYNLDLTSQVRFNEAFSGNIGAGYAMRQSFDSVREPGDVGFTTQPGNFANLHAALNYQIVPGTMAASLTYQYNDYSSRNVDFAATPGPDGGTRNRAENVFGVKFDYALN